MAQNGLILKLDEATCITAASGSFYKTLLTPSRCPKIEKNLIDVSVVQGACHCEQKVDPHLLLTPAAANLLGECGDLLAQCGEISLDFAVLDLEPAKVPLGLPRLCLTAMGCPSTVLVAMARGAMAMDCTSTVLVVMARGACRVRS